MEQIITFVLGMTVGIIIMCLMQINQPKKSYKRYHK